MANLSKTTLVKLDRLLAVAVGAANWFAVVASPVFGLLRSGGLATPNLAKTVTIAKFEGIGSILYALALARALKAANPSIKIKFFTREENANFLSRFSEIDEVIELRASSVFRLTFSWICSVLKVRSDIYIDLEVYSHFSALTSLASFSWWRAGFFRESANYRTGLYTHSVFFNCQKHISFNYLQIATSLGFDVKPTPLPAPLVRQEEVAAIKARYRQPYIAPILIVLNPNSSDLLYERRWPIENFAQVVIDICKKYQDVCFVVSGAPNERDYAKTLLHQLDEHTTSRVFLSAGDLSFGEFLALIKEADFLLTNDSGPMHLAFSFETPTLSLWGPVDRKHYGPLKNDIHDFVETNVFCSPCVHQTNPPPCRGDNICMKHMQVDAVFPKLCRMIDALKAGCLISSPTGYLLQPWVDERYSDGRPVGVATDVQFTTPLL